MIEHCVRDALPDVPAPHRGRMNEVGPKFLLLVFNKAKSI